MADMTPIVETLAGASRTFTLLEADIPTLTYRGNGVFDTATVAVYTPFAALAESIGYNLSCGSDERDEPGFFIELVAAKGEGDYGIAMPTGKTLLARAAVLLVNAGRPFPELVQAVLAMSLKGGGLSLAAAAGQAQIIARSPASAAGKFNHVQSVLVPQILNAAAAA